MKKIFKLLVVVTLATGLIMGFSSAALAHRGRTDSQGGHHDYQNVSGLGSYHYHHGYPAHLHPGGVCPYETSTTTTSAKHSTNSSSASSTATSHASSVSHIPLYINGQAVSAANQAILRNNRALVPLRLIGEKLGFTVEAQGQKVYLTSGSNYLIFTRGSKTYSVNGASYTSDSSPILYNNTTYIPLRTIANALGINLQYTGNRIYLTI